MPFYEYRCGACGHEFEELQKITDGALRKCPECGKLTLKRLVSAAKFQLKGTGWYETDFKTKKKPESKEETKVEKDKGPEKKPDKKADKKESKTDKQ